MEFGGIYMEWGEKNSLHILRSKRRENKKCQEEHYVSIDFT